MATQSENAPCPICRMNHAVKNREALKGRTFFECASCGEFEIDDLSLTLLSNGEHSDQTHAILSHWTRRAWDSARSHSDPSERPFVRVNKHWIDKAEKSSPEDPIQQLNNLIMWMGKNHIAGQEDTLAPESHMAVSGSTTKDSFGWVIETAEERNLIKGLIPKGLEDSDTILNASLTMSGWDYYHELATTSVDSKTAFMAMPFSNGLLDEVVEKTFKPAVAQTGFELQKVSDGQPAGLIDDQIRVRIRTSKFVICDLTDDNAGAYWAAGFAEGADIPVIYTCEKDKFESKKTHFDTNHLVTVLWSADDLDHAAETLKNTIRATFFDEAKMTDEPAASERIDDD